MKYIIFCLLFLFPCSSYAQTKSTKTIANKPRVVYEAADEMPKADYDYAKYLADNLHYPDSARENNVEGKVTIKFVVNEDGHVSNCKILRGFDRACDAEALRVVKSMPPWIPGRQNGKIIKVYFTLPIVFKLEDDSVKEDTGIFTYVDEMPEFTQDYGEYLTNNIRYPYKARLHNIEGRVIVKFVVNEDGHISDCVITKSVNDELDDEALRVIRNMPRWKPGKQKGKPVKVYFTAPIVFKLVD